jgi:hypothetical protein
MHEQLLESANRLVQPEVACADEFSGKRDQLAALGNQIMGRRPDLEMLVGHGNAGMAEDNNRNFARFMESLFTGYDPAVLVETVLWVFRTYRSHGFQTAYWDANLNIWVGMLKDELSHKTFEAVYPFYHWLMVNVPLFSKLTDRQESEAS